MLTLARRVLTVARRVLTPCQACVNPTPACVNPTQLEATDEFLIVASDGLWEVTTSSQAVMFVKRHLAKVPR